MIAKMSKYDFVLFAAQSGDFIERLRGLGLVDITVTGWEPSEEDRQLLLDIEGHARAEEHLRAFAAGEHFDAGAVPFASGAEAYAHYDAARLSAAALQAEIARLQKTADELRPWGEFSADTAGRLAAQGIVLRYFVANGSVYAKSAAEWSSRYTIEPIAEEGSNTYFVVVASPGEEVAIDAQEMKAPAMDICDAERLIAENETALRELDGEFSRAAASLPLLAEHAAGLKERLQEVRVTATARKEADGMLAVMEGWAEKETSERVDALLAEYPNVVWIKSDPAPGEDAPVKLKNNRFARIFEMVGDMYARPKYGTLDLTPFFAPFYVIFFGICLTDAGSGLILLLAGLFMLRRFREPTMRRAAWFATLCALSTVFFGLIFGSFFGLNLKEYFPAVPFFDFQGRFFSVALAIGVVQILFGMLLRVVMITSTLGFRYSFGVLGWFIVVLSASLAVGLPMLDPAWAIPHFGASSPAFYAALGAGGVLMLVLNTPGRNPLVNFGAGLWDFYNNLTGILSDVLSYIRLFAIGLSGGILATVFNDLAQGLSPDIPVVKVVVMVLILLVGHGINLFMSAISSFVHPMRLTFVEFYKNAGFEMALRPFDPLRKMNETKNE